MMITTARRLLRAMLDRDMCATDLVPVGLAAGASPCSINLNQNALRHDPPAPPPENCYLKIQSQGTRSCGLVAQFGRPAGSSLIFGCAKWLPSLRETAILWGD